MSNSLPDIVAPVRSLLASLPEEARPFFMARLERRAAENYRRWADQASHSSLAIGLRLCAHREEAVAEIIERCFPLPATHATAVQEVGRQVAAGADPFTGYQLEDCLRMQANAERSGAAAWRALAGNGRSAEERRDLEVCANLEEESATFLETALEV